jgi:chromosome segregation ATPase
VTDASSSFELLEFEQVQAGAKTVLLRLAARAPTEVTVEGLTLLVDGDGAPARLSPLPAPAGPADVVRAAFAVAPELLDVDTSFALELPDGSTVQLPAPTRRDAGRRPPATSRPPERTEDPRLAEAEQRAASRRLAIVELQRRLGAEHARRTQAETEARRARATATAEAATHVELRSRLDELAADAARLQAALDEAGQALVDQTESATTLTARVAELEQATAETTERYAAVEAELERTATDLAQVSGELSERDAGLRAATDELERERASHRDELERESASHRDELEAANASSEELRAQMTELECRLEDEQVRLEAAESDVHSAREQFAGVEAELAGVRAAAEEVAAALADRTTEVELLRDAAVARERELEEQLAAGREGFEDELSQRDVAADRAWEALAGSADLLLRQAAEVELLRVAGAERPEADAEAGAVAPAAPTQELEELAEQARQERERADELARRLAETEEALASKAAETDEALAGRAAEIALLTETLRERDEQVTTLQAAREEADKKLEQTLEARRLPPELEAYERELIELRGAVERAQNRARLHRQHSGTLETELAEAKKELGELRQQIAVISSSSDEAASVGEVESLREQVAYGQALASDLEWQLEEARATEEAADAALAIRAAEVELLAMALRERGSGPTA